MTEAVTNHDSPCERPCVRLSTLNAMTWLATRYHLRVSVNFCVAAANQGLLPVLDVPTVRNSSPALPNFFAMNFKITFQKQIKTQRVRTLCSCWLQSISCCTAVQLYKCLDLPDGR